MIYGQWLSLPLSTRIGIASHFGIRKVRSTHVVNDEIADDGYVVHDIEAALSLESIQKFLDTKETDFQTLWKMLVDKMNPKKENREENAAIGFQTGAVIKVPKPRGRPRKVK